MTKGNNLPILVASLLLATQVAILIGNSHALAQTKPADGLEKRSPSVHALVGARIAIAPGQFIDGNIIVRDGRIDSVGTAPPPADAVEWDCRGRTITAGWIELDAPVPLAPVAAGPERPGRSWNEHVQPERSALEALPLAESLRDELRQVGFTLALAAPAEGVLAGGGALVALCEAPESERDSIVLPLAAQFASLEHGRTYRDPNAALRPESNYPSSRMGAVALLRQTLYDADWYRRAWEATRTGGPRAPQPERNESLAALAPALDRTLPVAFRCADLLELFTLQRVATEFQLRAWYYGAGDEFRWLDDLARSRAEVVLPAWMPPAPAIERPEQLGTISLEQLELWARAPENAARLERAGVPFAISSRLLAKRADLLLALRLMRERGASEAALLAALTTRPAEMLGLGARLGSIEAGKDAHLTVLEGGLFTEFSRVLEVWVAGERIPVADPLLPDPRGVWAFAITPQGEAAAEPRSARVLITGELGGLRLKVEGAERERDSVGVRREKMELRFQMDGAAFGESGQLLASGRLAPSGTELDGWMLAAGGVRLSFRGRWAEALPEKEQPRPASTLWAGSLDEPIAHPLGARGRLEPPHAPERVLFQDATIWTGGSAGILEEADLLIDGGSIEAVGKDLPTPEGAETVSARGLHITAGIIDPHSHTAIVGGVNEGTQAATAEVRIGDSVNPNDINIYRQLAGGVTAAQLLHGSANPIGGQSAIVKLRWGENAEGLLMRGAPPTIKFALGENVKQSNWGDQFTRRYPQTRMGVAQVIRDRFEAAKLYRDAWQAYRRAGGVPPRRDLELEALVEILDGKRWIHCHSYRQDEILMLMRLGEQMGFRVGTFQHTLEGYKVAPEIARHGAAASIFSDWWAYKFEVYDAIPYNAALLRNAGVSTTFNSDSNEMARRMNVEAAKAVKYGGLAPQEAWSFVTLAGAEQLRVEARVGSLEPKKDADFVLWSGNPLSTYSVCLETWIEGKRRFERGEDLRLRERDAARKMRLVQRLLEERRLGQGARPLRAQPGDTPAIDRHDHDEYECCPKGAGH